MNRWLDGTAAPRGGMGYAHDAGPFNMHAELERVLDLCASARTCR